MPTYIEYREQIKFNEIPKADKTKAEMQFLSSVFYADSTSKTAFADPSIYSNLGLVDEDGNCIDAFSLTLKLNGSIEHEYQAFLKGIAKYGSKIKTAADYQEILRAIEGRKQDTVLFAQRNFSKYFAEMKGLFGANVFVNGFKGILAASIINSNTQDYIECASKEAIEASYRFVDTIFYSKDIGQLSYDIDNGDLTNTTYKTKEIWLQFKLETLAEQIAEEEKFDKLASWLIAQYTQEMKALASTIFIDDEDLLEAINMEALDRNRLITTRAEYQKLMRRWLDRDARKRRVFVALLGGVSGKPSENRTLARLSCPITANNYVTIMRNTRVLSETYCDASYKMGPDGYIDYIKLNKHTKSIHLANLAEPYIAMANSKAIRKFYPNGDKDTSRQPVLFNFAGGFRPSKKSAAFTRGSGIITFDIDLKNSVEFNNTVMRLVGANNSEHQIDEAELQLAAAIRDRLYDRLCEMPWFVTSVLSGGRKGVHIYAQDRQIPTKLIKNSQINENHAAFWHKISYAQKAAIIRAIIKQDFNIDIIFGKATKTEDGKEKAILDSSVTRLTQPTTIAFQPDGVKLNPNFVLQYAAIDIHKTPSGITLKDIVADKIANKLFGQDFSGRMQATDLDNVCIKHDTTHLENTDSRTIAKDYCAEKLIKINRDNINVDLSELKPHPDHKAMRYDTRWKICNTAVDIFGLELGTKISLIILDPDKPAEIEAFCRSAHSNNRSSSKFGIRFLEQCGIDIEISAEQAEENKRVYKAIEEIQLEKEIVVERYDTTLQWITEIASAGTYIAKRNAQPNCTIELAQGEFVATKISEIENALVYNKINYISSAPATGKTHAFTNMAFEPNERILIVVPYRSIVSSKIDEHLATVFEQYDADNPLYNIRKSEKPSAIMTFDQFAAMPLAMYKRFTKIIIDEVHLVSNEGYRDRTPFAIENIVDYIMKYGDVTARAMEALSWDYLPSMGKTQADTPKIIVMTGTPTQEVDIFDKLNVLNYIKINKQHEHGKKAVVYGCKGDAQQIAAFDIAKHILNGGKCIIPTNRGEEKISQLVGAIESQLEREVLYEIYSRSNRDSSIVQNINNNATLGDVDILFCTTYLSVGVDINDIADFKLFFIGNEFGGNDIEQYCNRLRKTKIDAAIYYNISTNKDGEISTANLNPERPDIKTLIDNLANIEQLETFSTLIADEIEDDRQKLLLEHKTEPHPELKFRGKYHVDVFGKTYFKPLVYAIKTTTAMYDSYYRNPAVVYGTLLMYDYEIAVRIHDGISESAKQSMKSAASEMRKTRKLTLSQQRYLAYNYLLDAIEEYNIARDFSASRIFLAFTTEPIENAKLLSLETSEDAQSEYHQYIEKVEKHNAINMRNSIRVRRIKYSAKRIFKQCLMLQDSLGAATSLYESIAKDIRVMLEVYDINTARQIIDSTFFKQGIYNQQAKRRYLSAIRIMTQISDRKSSKIAIDMLQTIYTHCKGDVNDDRIKFQIHSNKYEEIINGTVRKYKFELGEYLKLEAEQVLKTEESTDNLKRQVKNILKSVFQITKARGGEFITLRILRIFNFNSAKQVEKMQADELFKNMLTFLTADSDTAIEQIKQMHLYNVDVDAKRYEANNATTQQSAVKIPKRRTRKNIKELQQVNKP